MPVDWAAVSESIRLGTTGRAAEGLRLLIVHEATCESDRDRAAICNGKAMCYAHLGNFQEAFAQIKAACGNGTGFDASNRPFGSG